MTDSYPVPQTQIIIEEEIKHSRFISIMFQCQDESAFKCALTNIKKDYPGASHYCYAYVLSAPWNDIDVGCSDDGEPAGSAGRPMLAVLQSSGIGEVAAVVVRYFGGTKLGVGGLVRAYSSGVKLGVKQLPLQSKLIRFEGRLVCDYQQLKDVEYVLNNLDGLILQQHFSEQIAVEFALPLNNQKKLNEMLATLSQGKLQAEFTL